NYFHFHAMLAALLGNCVGVLQPLWFCMVLSFLSGFHKWYISFCGVHRTPRWYAYMDFFLLQMRSESWASTLLKKITEHVFCSLII
ncbi:hypothetical protein L9F63_021404, partial [Diploptera punctata]